MTVEGVLGCTVAVGAVIAYVQMFRASAKSNIQQRTAKAAISPTGPSSPLRRQSPAPTAAPGS